MKKTLIFLVLLLVVGASLPIIGNKIVTYYIDGEIVTLKSKGITLNFKSETPGYFYTSKQYEFILNDVDAFAGYLTEYGAGLLPPYTDELLKSIVFRLDMKYHNIPFLEPISIDIYPMYISDGMMSKLQGSENIFFKNFQKFVTRQGLLYHIDYDLLSENYSGYIKNIDYNERNYDGSNIILTLHNAVFNGSGAFNGSSSLQSDVEKIFYKTTGTSKEISVEITKMSTKSTKTLTQTTEEMYDETKEMYDKSKDMYQQSGMPERVETLKKQSENAVREMYDTSMKMKSMFFKSKDTKTNEETNIEIEGSDINISSQKDGETTKNKSYFFFESLNLKSTNIDLEMSTVKYDSSMSGMDTKTYKELKSLASLLKEDPSLSVLNDLKVSAINLLSNGLKVQVPELSVANVNYYGEDLGGFKLHTALNVKEDKHLAAKMLFSPLFIVQNIDFKINLTLSKKIFNRFIQDVPFAIVSTLGSKQTAKDLMYDISYINGNLRVNGKSVI